MRFISPDLTTQGGHYTVNFRTIFFSLFAMAASSMACADNFNLLEEGQAAFNAKEYNRAYKLWHSLAVEGHVDAQVFVGLAHKNGWGVRKDPKQANMWLQMAAEGGNSSAQFFLGLHYVSSAEPQIVDIGVDWLVRAAENGDLSAKQFLIKAKINNWLDVPGTLSMKAVVTEVTPDNIDDVFASKAE